jgi:4-hydroxy-2-oxoheptanedioate aldolase
MKTNPVKRCLREGRAQVGTWLSLNNAIATRFMARAGWNWLTLDMEHSPIDWESAATHFALIADAGSVPLVRVPSISIENAKRALDVGAYGIVFPMCNSVAEAELAVAACRYPPSGKRSVGGSLHALNFGCSPAEYYANANDEILVVVQIEHIDAVKVCEQIMSVEGVDAVFVGPNDLLSSMGKVPQMETDDPEFVAALDKILSTAKRLGVASGIHVANAEAAQRRMAQGWQFIAISSELGFMCQAAAETVSQAVGQTNTNLARY